MTQSDALDNILELLQAWGLNDLDSSRVSDLEEVLDGLHNWSVEQGEADGYEEGRRDGWDDGYDTGYSDGEVMGERDE